MSNRSRIGNKWTVNEVLSLQREFELLGWDIDQIASKHKRTPEGIMNKLDAEGFADYNVLYSNYHNLNSKMAASVVSKTQELNLVLEDNDESDCDDDQDEDYVDNGEEDDEDEDEDEDDDPLSRRVTNLESRLDDIKIMLQNLTMRLLDAENVTRTNDRPCTSVGC